MQAPILVIYYFCLLGITFSIWHVFINEPRWIHILPANKGDSFEIAAIPILSIAPRRPRVGFMPLLPPKKTIDCRLDVQHVLFRGPGLVTIR